MIGIGALGIFAVREDVVAADGRIAPVEDVTFPFADERALGRTALIAGVGIDGPRALRRPAHDLDPAARGIVDEKTVAFERGRRRVDHAHRDARQVRRKVGIQIVDGVRHGDSHAEGNVSTVEFSGGAPRRFYAGKAVRDAYNPPETKRTHRRTPMEWLIAVIAIAVGVPAAAWLMQDSLIFFPQPASSTAHLPAHARRSRSRRRTVPALHGWIAQGSAVPSPTVIYFGGNAEEVSHTLADPHWPREWSIVAVNYRGYGTSEGKPGERDLTSDALTIYDAVAARDGVDGKRIVVFGRSLGTALAAHVAAERPVAGVILVSPYDSPGRHRQPSLPVASGFAAAEAPFRGAGRCASLPRADAHDRGELRLDHSRSALTRAVRRVGGTEALASRAGFRPQLAGGHV